MIYILDKYKSLLDIFIPFLKNLSVTDWKRKTILPNWRVVEIVAHLLSGAIRKYSSILNYQSGNIKHQEKLSYNYLVNYINTKNEKWVNILKDLNTNYLIELLNENYNRLISKLNELNPKHHFIHSVAWAGEDISKNWFDIAREYTELWHHQMQIREVFNDYKILEDYYFHDVINTFFMALPYHFKKLKVDNDYKICIKIIDMKNGNWILNKSKNLFTVINQPMNNNINIVEIEKSISWKIFTKAISHTKAKSLINYRGDESICLHILKMVCIMI